MANPSSPSALSMRKDSHSISKTKPKIRIIHIFAPEIIKTDVDNFRELVQRLTGKPAGNDQKSLRRIKKSRMVCRKGSMIFHDKYEDPGQLQSSSESRGMVVKREELGIWNADSSGSFLNGFEHLDGYVQALVEFPVLLSTGDQTASTSSSSSQSTMNTFEL
ncbi:VQ motif-containing protein 25-like [Punica granatum]|uniref:VQ motif-containing protein 25-like n=1 Tax=Punica granatum TaxID=22663 RepID=A0A218XCI5_PUNGR|nr:VQ motif-containing protein 25-like [Punica granatum]OWM82657.1 hypothetical protein CDL15_Pgr002232 [Punica granatum]